MGNTVWFRDGIVFDSKAEAHADLLLIEGNRLDDITLLQRAETPMVVIMKGGDIVKNTLPPTPAE